MSTYQFIKNREFNETMAISKLLLSDGKDLMHKAVGSMLREVGNHDVALEKTFMEIHCRQMPRTMLRHATEKGFPERERKQYLKGTA